MSFFRKLFLGDPEALRKRAAEHFEAGRFGEAKLDFEKARDALPKNETAAREELAARALICRDRIAQERLDAGAELLAAGEIALAIEEYRGAHSVASSEELRGRAQEAIDAIDRDAVRAEQRVVKLSREDRIAILAGSWYEDQAEEYAGYGDRFFDGVLAMDDEQFDKARECFAAELADAESPRYLILEHAKACTLSDRLDEALEGYRRFLTALGEGEGGDRRLGTYLQIGAILNARDEYEGALDAFQQAVEDFPDDYRPYYALGQQLRISGAVEEGLEVLELAKDKCPGVVDWTLLEEIGVAHAELGQDDAAVSVLDGILQRFLDRGNTELPGRTVFTLAELYEKRGRLDRAADMWRLLTERGPARSRAKAYVECGRLVGALGMDEEAARMLKRGIALAAETDEGEALKTDAEAKLANLMEAGTPEE